MIELSQEEKFFVTEALKIYLELYEDKTFLNDDEIKQLTGYITSASKKLDIDLNNKNKEKKQKGGRNE